MLAKAGSV